MRLITKTTLLYLLIALLVFGVGGVITYQMIRQMVDRETDYSLAQNMYLIEEAIKEGKPIDALNNKKTQIEKVTNIQPKDTLYLFTDTMAMHPYWKRLEPHRKLTITRKINEEYYRISMFDIFMESDDVSEGVISVMTRLFLGLGLMLLLCSFLISSWLFEPFQKTLQKISAFNLKNDDPVQFAATSTKEFSKLNDFITQMTTKARQDYISLKEFSENAAHEMQTPIAVANGKLELLLENPDLNSRQLELIQSAQTALSKLSKLGQSLSLLTKIENKEFSNLEITNFSTIVTQATDNFKDISELKGISLESHIEKNILLGINASLSEILVNNLLKNAVRYNLPNGWISINLNKNQLIIKNPGMPPKISTSQLFERFRKSNQSENSLGLGLAIVKKICEVNNFEVNYLFDKGIHQLTVEFSS